MNGQWVSGLPVGNNIGIGVSTSKLKHSESMGNFLNLPSTLISLMTEDTPLNKTSLNVAALTSSLTLQKKGGVC